MRWVIGQLPKSNHRWWWAFAVLTLMLTLLLLSQLDFAEFRHLLGQLYAPFLLVALVFFLLEAIVTALRIRMFAHTNPTLAAATQANAWYVLLVLLLPARLGEVAAVIIFEKFLGLPRGAAMASIIAQRMFDVMLIGLLFVLASLVVLDMQTSSSAFPLAIVAVAATLVAVIRLTDLLTLGARILHGKKRPAHGARKALLKLLLQARNWHRRFLTPRRALAAFTLTLLKWLATMAGIAFTLFALQIPLDEFQIWAASAVYNFTAIVPIHTVGGLGMGEVGLTAVLSSMGVTLSSAVGVALFLRMALIGFTFGYFFIVVSAHRLQIAMGGTDQARHG